MNVRVKWYENRLEFTLEMENDRPIKIKFYKSDSNIFTDERDDCNGVSKWFFFIPDNDCDYEGLQILGAWFRTKTYREVFETLALSEGTSTWMPGYSFRKADQWCYWNDVLIIVQTVAYNI